LAVNLRQTPGLRVVECEKHYQQAHSRYGYALSDKLWDAGAAWFMVEIPIEQQILEQVERLNLEQKRKVLGFARNLQRSSRLKGESGEELLRFLDAMEPFNLDELQLMEQAIEEDCEHITAS